MFALLSIIVAITKLLTILSINNIVLLNIIAINIEVAKVATYIIIIE